MLVPGKMTKKMAWGQCSLHWEGDLRVNGLMASGMVRECSILLMEIGGRGNGRMERSMATALPTVTMIDLGWSMSGRMESSMATSPSSLPTV